MQRCLLDAEQEGVELATSAPQLSPGHSQSREGRADEHSLAAAPATGEPYHDLHTSALAADPPDHRPQPTDALAADHPDRRPHTGASAVDQPDYGPDHGPHTETHQESADQTGTAAAAAAAADVMDDDDENTIAMDDIQSQTQHAHQEQSSSAGIGRQPGLS